MYGGPGNPELINYFVTLLHPLAKIELIILLHCYNHFENLIIYFVTLLHHFPNNYLFNLV